jgi:hypothetical protein
LAKTVQKAKVTSPKVKAPRSRRFTDDEQSQIITDLLALKKSQIGGFLAQVNLPRSGTKEQIRDRIETSLASKSLLLGRVVEFLDEVIPWGKQHVYLYDGPKTSIADWRNSEHVSKLLAENGIAHLLNARLPLVLPDVMTLSSIVHDGKRLRVIAIKKREWWERDEHYDAMAVTEEGDDVQFHAFVRRVTRSLVAFDWSLTSNTAFLQISQLPSRGKYDEVAKEFFDLVGGWLDRSNFATVDLRPVIKKLHELEEAKKAEARSHGIRYRTLAGNRLEGRSVSRSKSFIGDAVIGAAMSGVRKAGVPHLGNFYWLPGSDGSPLRNMLDDEVHLEVHGADHRINFRTPNSEDVVRYVLSRIRSHCQRPARPPQPR